MNKIFKYSFLSLFAALTMVSCSNDYEYEMAVPESEINAENNQVYFPFNSASQYTLDGTKNSLDLTICRFDSIGAQTVRLQVEGDSLVKIPETVSFADGQSETVLTLTYDAETLGYDNPQNITICIADSAETTAYGMNKYTFNVSIPSPWTSLGEATLTDDIVSTLFNVENVSFPVEIQENDLVPGYYRLVNPYTSCYPYNGDGDYDPTKTFYMYIHAENPDQVYYEMTDMGADWGYGMMFTVSYAGYYLANGKTEEEITAAGLWGTLKDGEITFPVKSLLFGMANYDDAAMFYANQSGLFSILLPGYVKADYSAEVQYAGIFTAADQTVSAVANLTLGADATDVKAIVMTQADDAIAVADALAAGELEGTPVQAGRIEVPFNGDELGDSKLQIVVAVIADGELKALATTDFEYYGGGSNPWQSLGMGTYTESLICSMFKGMEPVTYEVEILENTETPGLYRVMNAYANGTYPYADNDCAAEGTYLEINACDPEGVYVPMQSLGFDWGYGEFGFISEGARYLEQYDMETVKNAGLLGTLKDGVITLPNMERETDAGVTYYQGIAYMGTDGYYAGMKDGFCVTLPGAAAKAPKYARSQFVQSLERNLVGKKFVPVVNKRMVKCASQPAL